MYSIDSNILMNASLLGLLGIGLLMISVTLLAAWFGKRGRAMSYLWMFSGIFIVFGVLISLLGFRGRTSTESPWTFFLDMKYQPKYTAQGGSRFFSDHRESRLPVDKTVPFDGGDYSADAGFHGSPKADFLEADHSYYRGIANPSARELKDGVLFPKDLEWKDGKPLEGYFVAHIPNAAIDRAGGWAMLIKQGQAQFNTHCAACHGGSGRGGAGVDAHGVVGAYGLSIAPADITAVLYQSQPDGQLFHTIGQGKGSMSGYAHQIKVEDRWAIVSYIRVLQFAHNPVAK